MRHLKRIIFIMLGLAFVIGPVYGIIFALTHTDKFEATIGNVIGMTVIGIIMILIFSILGAVINKFFEDSGITIFTAFFLFSFKKRKRLYHSTMGEFELIIDEDNLEGLLVKQGFLHCKEIAKFDLERKNFMETIKQHLDSKYKDEIAEREERKRKRELVKVLMKEEGYLDVVGKRDDKISKLGI
jgi:hypothetical protein